MTDLALKGQGSPAHSVRSGSRSHMFTHQGGAPRVNAIEDFAIFAQPNRIRAVEAAVRAEAIESRCAKNRPRHRHRHDACRRHAALASRKPGAARRDLRILELSGDRALMETADGYRRVRVGDEMPGHRQDHFDPAEWAITGSSSPASARSRRRAPVATIPTTATLRPSPDSFQAVWPSSVLMRRPISRRQGSRRRRRFRRRRAACPRRRSVRLILRDDMGARTLRRRKPWRRHCPCRSA